jgi:hypothetical protein
MPTTARADVVDGILSVLNAYRVANPTKLRRVLSKRPGGFAEVPVAYLGFLDEEIIHTSGTRQRTFAGATVVVVDNFHDSPTNHHRFDELIDGLVDAFTASPHAVPGAVLTITSVRDGEISIEGQAGVNVYPSATITFGELVIMEGRN